MLLNNSQKFEKDDIVSFKLVNGDEIVAKVISDDATGYTVDRPCTVMPSAQGIGLLQSLFTSEMKKPVTISKQHVMFAGETIKEMQTHYTKTTTGIDIITSGSIVS
jgi:hypothetical protein